MIDEATDSFLLIPQDLSDLSSWQTMAGQAIDANTLVAALSRIEARDALLFLDTCHAGKVSADNLANVGHESGRYLLAASSSGQDAEGNVGALTLGEYVSRRVGQLAVEKHHAQNAIFCTAQQDLRSFSIGHVTR